ncbi:MAG TPA: tetratricopeptide repeat protein, partial [Vicinamibacteria bacterium]|nr:tetratricopeptide repeat protein [Vicinamibacteria bacterium]
MLSRLTGGARGGGDDVSALIGKKNYTRAIEVIREQLLSRRNDPRLRLQLADVLVSAGKVREAVTILLPLADEFAKDGFAAKAISVLKKIQKIEPGRRDIDARLANVIQEKQQQATIVVPMPPSGALEIGMEEIGIEAPVSAEPSPARVAPPAPAPAREKPEPAASPEPDLGLEAAPELDFSSSGGPGVEPAPAEAGPEFDLGMEGGSEVEEAPLDLGLEPIPAVE